LYFLKNKIKQNLIVINADVITDLKLNKLKSFDNFTREITNIFQIKVDINKIEAFDNSHTFGKFPVGVMIAYNNNGFIKSNYRREKLKRS